MNVYPNNHHYQPTTLTLEPFDIKEANPAFIADWIHLAIRRFTEAEIADILRYAYGSHLLKSKDAKLKLASDVATKITPWLWDQPHPYRREATFLARKMETLQGLMSIVKLAEVR
jgi:hypothetical protein